MRFRVEVEVSEVELPAATELLSVIRLLTEHVKGSQLVVNGVGGASTALVPSAGAALVAAAPPAVPLREQIRSVLVRVAPDGANANQIAQEVAAFLTPIMDQPAASDPKYIAHVGEELAEAFTAAAFDPALLAAGRGSSAFARVIAAVPDTIMKVGGTSCASAKVVRKTLAQVTKKRADDAPRESYALPSEAFAVLAATGVVANFNGALSSMCKILQKGEACPAAIDTLCRIMQVAESKLAGGEVQAETAEQLLTALDDVSESCQERLAQEIAFLKSKLQPLAPAAVPALPAPATTPGTSLGAVPPATLQLQPGGQVPLAGGSIFALAYEPTQQQLIVGGKDTPIVVVGSNSQPLYEFHHLNQYVCAIDVSPRHSLALAALSPVEDPQGNLLGISSVQVFNSNAWGPRASINRPNVGMVPCLKVLADGSTFVTGESFLASTAGVRQECVCAYDLGTALSAGINAQPVRTWGEHADLVSCVAAIPGQPSLFVSGSRDTTIKLWDMREDKSVGALIHSTESGTALAHAQMVTCIDAAGPGGLPLLVSSGLDGSMAAWDMRMLGSNPVIVPLLAVPQVDCQAVLKVTLADSPYPNLVAIATVLGIYALDLQTTTGADLGISRVVTAQVYEDLTSSQFNDIRWGSYAGRPTLFAACSDRPRVDALVVTA